MSRSKPRRPARGEQGQVTTALVIVVIVALVTLGMVGVFALARGVDEKTKAQSAADAAALAGASALTAELPGLLGLVGSKDDIFSLSVGCGLGQDRASTYAGRNGATLTEYCFDLGADRVTARVEMTAPVSEDVGPAKAGSVASTGLDLSDCSWNDDEPEPTPTPTPTPTEPPDDPPSPPPPPPPPPDIGTTLSCGPFTAHFLIGGITGLLTLVDVEIDELEPSLVE